MRKWLNNYFDFTKSEFNGLLVLLVLVLLVYAVPYVYPSGLDDDPVEEQLVLQRISLINNENELAVRPYRPAVNRGRDRSFTKAHELFYFDPNIIGVQEWRKLGLSEKQAASIVRYVSKGGSFKTASDLKKMYTVSASFYEKIAPYIEISPKAGEPKEAFYMAQGKKKTEAVLVEINAADSSSLLDINGIGPVFASRILKYRNKLGGYYDKAQLMEVFGIDSLKYKDISAQVVVDDSRVKKININTAEVDDFKNHPYVRYKQANAIVQYRNQHGNYTNIADLNKVVILPKETISRIAPYLTF